MRYACLTRCDAESVGLVTGRHLFWHAYETLNVLYFVLVRSGGFDVKLVLIR